jgi:hypothetical protein
MAKDRTHKRPRLMKVSCSRVDRLTLRCSVSWHSGTTSYAGTGKFFHFLQGSTAYWWYDFTGIRTRLTCRNRHRTSVCIAHHQHFRWR